MKLILERQWNWSFSPIRSPNYYSLHQGSCSLQTAPMNPPWPTKCETSSKRHAPTTKCHLLPFKWRGTGCFVSGRYGILPEHTVISISTWCLLTAQPFSCPGCCTGSMYVQSHTSNINAFNSSVFNLSTCPLHPPLSTSWNISNIYSEPVNSDIIPQSLTCTS